MRMRLEPKKENEDKIGAWMKMFGAYIQSGEIQLTQKQLEKAVDLINDIADRILDNQQEYQQQQSEEEK